MCAATPPRASCRRDADRRWPPATGRRAPRPARARERARSPLAPAPAPTSDRARPPVPAIAVFSAARQRVAGRLVDQFRRGIRFDDRQRAGPVAVLGAIAEHRLRRPRQRGVIVGAAGVFERRLMVAPPGALRCAGHAGRAREFADELEHVAERKPQRRRGRRKAAPPAPAAAWSAARRRDACALRRRAASPCGRVARADRRHAAGERGVALFAPPRLTGERPSATAGGRRNG